MHYYMHRSGFEPPDTPLVHLTKSELYSPDYLKKKNNL